MLWRVLCRALLECVCVGYPPCSLRLAIYVSMASVSVLVSRFQLADGLKG